MNILQIDASLNLICILITEFTLFSQNMLQLPAKLARSSLFSVLTHQGFAVEKPPSSHSVVKQRILRTRKFSEFVKIVGQSSPFFDASLYSEVSKHLKTLFYDRKQHAHQTQPLMTSLENLKVASLSAKDATNMLTVLRTFKTKGLPFYNKLDKLKIDLIGRYTALINENSQKLSFQEVVSFFYEYCFFQDISFSGPLLDKIITFLDDPNTKIQLRQAITILSSLSWKQVMRPKERLIRKKVLFIIQTRVAQLSQDQLIKSVTIINRMNVFELDFYQKNYIKVIYGKAVQKVADISQESVLSLLKSPLNIKFLPALKLYSHIMTNLCTLIQPDGKSLITVTQMATMLTHIGDKLRLRSLEKAQQDKILAFLNRYASQCRKKNEDGLFSNLVASLLAQDFFTDNQSRLVNIVLTHKIKLSLKSLFLLSTKEISMDPFVSQIKQYSLQKITLQNSVLLGLILKSFGNEIQPQLSEKIQKVFNIINRFMNTPPNFTKTIKQLIYSKNGPHFLRLFNKNFKEIIQNLPNPFQVQVESHLIEQYREAYLSYMLEALNQHEIRDFFNKYQDKIQNGLVCYLISKDYRPQNFWKTPRVIFIQVMAKRIGAIVQKQDKKFIVVFLKMLKHYCVYVVGNSQDQLTSRVFYQLVHFTVHKLSQKPQSYHRVVNILEAILVTNNKNYNIEPNHQNLVRLLLTKIKIWDKNHLSCLIIQNGLRLHIVQKNHLQNIKFSDYFIKRDYKEELAYIFDPTFTPKIQRLNPSSLRTIFYNKNLYNFMTSHLDQIQKIIKKQSAFTLYRYLTSFNHKKDKVTSIILNSIFQKLSKQEKLSEGTHLSSILKNAIKNQYDDLQKYCVFLKNTLSQNRLQNFSFAYHCELVNSLLLHTNFNAFQYLQRLAKFYRKDKQKYQELQKKVAGSKSQLEKIFQPSNKQYK